MKVFRVYMKANRHEALLVGADSLEDVIKNFSSRYGMKAIAVIEPTDLPLDGVRTIIGAPKKDQLDLFG